MLNFVPKLYFIPAKRLQRWKLYGINKWTPYTTEESKQSDTAGIR